MVPPDNLEKEVYMKRVRHVVRVHFVNGDSFISDINGTKAEVKRYYKIGRQFNLGGSNGRDAMQSVTSLEFLAQN